MDPYIGEIRLFAFSFPVSGWLPCDGALYNVKQYSALASLLGKTYGGDGQVQFAVPDFRGRVAMHFGTDPAGNSYQLGQRSGQEEVALTAAQVPPHNHTVRVSSETSSPGLTGYPAVIRTDSQSPPVTPSLYAANAPSVALSADTVADAGAGAAHRNVQPSLVLGFFIAYQGTYPDRP